MDHRLSKQLAVATAKILASAGVALATAVAVGAAAAPLAPDNRVIPAGVSAGGVDLSNLTVDAAAGKLAGTVGARLASPLSIAIAGHSFRVAPAAVSLRFDALGTAKRAYDAGSARPAAPAGTPAPAVTVPLDVSHAAPAVRRVVAKLARRTNRPARDARVHITLRHIFRRHSRPGYHVLQPKLAAAIDQALEDPAAARTIRVPVVPERPKLTARALARRYRAIVTIDRAHFRLRLFIHLRFAKRYSIAVGRVGLATPRGLYRVREKQVNPPWHVPNSSWAGALAGHTIPGGAPGNPLKARWLGLGGGIGIHGTSEGFSIGSRASHGCIRMHVGDVIALYRRVPRGSEVLIR